MFEAVADGVDRKARVMLFAAESLFLGGSGDMAVLDQRRRAVVVEGGDAENAQRASLLRKSCK